MRYIIDTDVLEKDGFDEVIEIIECYGEPLEEQTKSQMNLSELRTLLDNYEDKDIVQLRIYGSSDCPSAGLVINDNTIMSKEY